MIILLKLDSIFTVSYTHLDVYKRQSISFAARGGAQYWQYMGRRVSLLGGNPEWETISTMVQPVSRDLQTNVIELSYGAPLQLSLIHIYRLCDLMTMQTQAQVETAKAIQLLAVRIENICLLYTSRCE